MIFGLFLTSFVLLAFPQTAKAELLVYTALEDDEIPVYLESFQKALKADPAWADGYRYLSIALESNGNFSDAAAASRKALMSRPDCAECLRLYIHQMLRLERRKEARETLLRLIDKHPSVAHVHNALGELYFYDDQLETAKSHFTRAGRLGSSSGYNNLGVVLMIERRYSDAAAAFEQCLQQDPSHHGALSNLQKVRNRT